MKTILQTKKYQLKKFNILNILFSFYYNMDTYVMDVKDNNTMRKNINTLNLNK